MGEVIWGNFGNRSAEETREERFRVAKAIFKAEVSSDAQSETTLIAAAAEAIVAKETLTDSEVMGGSAEEGKVDEIYEKFAETLSVLSVAQQEQAWLQAYKILDKDIE